MAQILYTLSILLAVADVAAVAGGAYLFVVGGLLQGGNVQMVTGIIIAVLGLVFRYPIQQMRYKTRQDAEYDQNGMSKSKSYVKLSKKERDMIDLQKTADVERILSSSELKKLTKQGAKDPDKEMAELIGMGEVKAKMEEMVARMEFEAQESGRNKKKRSADSMSGRHMVMFGRQGTGKAQPLYSKVLTPDGWVKMGDIHVGDLVTASDGSSATVMGVYPQGKKKVFELIFSDGSRCRCSDEHLWSVIYKGKKKATMTLNEILDAGLLDWDKEKRRWMSNFSVPKFEPEAGRCHQVGIVNAVYIGEEECQCIYISSKDHLYITDDYILTHNTTIARIMTGFLFRYGYISKNQIIEVDGNFLRAGEYTAQKVNLLCQKAYGGVLFIDEAYALMYSSDGSGEEAIATLIKQMEDHRGQFVVILAGYTDEMKQLLSLNPGFTSRIKEYLFFPDYTDEEMRQIFEFMAKKQGFSVDSHAWDAFDERVNRERRTEQFANARTARNILTESVDRHSLNFIKKKEPEEMRHVVQADDIPRQPKGIF